MSQHSYEEKGRSKRASGAWGEVDPLDFPVVIVLQFVVMHLLPILILNMLAGFA